MSGVFEKPGGPEACILLWSIERIRERAQVTKFAGLTGELGWSQNSYHGYVSGEHDMPLSRFCQVANFFGYDVVLRQKEHSDEAQ